MNKLSTEKRTHLSCLVEGNSLRATARMCDVAFNTVLKCIPEIGEACAEYQDKVFRNLKKFSVMKFGHSATPSQKMFLKRRKAHLVMVTCGHG
jgi:hypothetical protein